MLTRLDLPSSLQSDKKLDKSILLAQEIDLENFLGDDFYKSLIDDLALINGTPTQTTGVWYDLWQELKTVLVYWSYIRLLEMQMINVTRASVVKKSNEFSDRADQKDMARETHRVRRIANFYAQKVVKFIIENKDNYPYFCGWSAGNVTAFKFSILSKNARFN